MCVCVCGGGGGGGVDFHGGDVGIKWDDPRVLESLSRCLVLKQVYICPLV